MQHFPSRERYCHSSETCLVQQYLARTVCNGALGMKEDGIGRYRVRGLFSAAAKLHVRDAGSIAYQVAQLLEDQYCILVTCWSPGTRVDLPPISSPIMMDLRTVLDVVYM
jgi:hypothetical protein